MAGIQVRKGTGMNRIMTIEIAGKTYPLSFSLGAIKKIASKYGSLEKAFNTMANSKELTVQSISCLTFVLSVLISQGCAYIKTFEADLPKTVETTPITAEEIETVTNMTDIQRLADAIMDGMKESEKKEIETKAKNARAPKAI